MVKHMGIDENVQQYVVNFSNTKTVEVTFRKAFNKKPVIHVTMGDSGMAPVYKTDATTTGCKIRFKTKWTGEVEMTASERGESV